MKKKILGRGLDFEKGACDFVTLRLKFPFDAACIVVIVLFFLMKYVLNHVFEKKKVRVQLLP